MECTQSSSTIHKTLVLFLLLSNSIFLASADDRRTYIVHWHPQATSFFGSALEKIKWYESLLPNKSQLVYSYNKVINGFAARLSSKELAVLKLVDGFLQAIPDETLELKTTHSPMFLGLTPNTSGVWPDADFGKGIIIGVLDTGIKVGHPSFGDNGLLPSPPAKWKGSCEFNPSDCNNKLIGTKAFINGTQGGAPYDDDGHGTHVASTAAGMFVEGANVDGQAIGTAAGMAPYAHIAMYKVCHANGCKPSDILAGLESAIEDGVDIVSLSLGRNSSTPPSPFYQDVAAIGTFAAIKQGIFVSISAGNNGPSLATLSNEAPWMLTVGASSVDRFIGGRLFLNNGPSFTGETLYMPNDFPNTYYPLAYPNSVAPDCSDLTGLVLTGMVVLCDSGYIDDVNKSINVKMAGGVGVIVANLMKQGYTTSPSDHVLPALAVNYDNGQQIKAYLLSQASPMVAITFDGTILGTKPAPAVAYFSSRGPSTEGSNILKPDIIGPGLNILAAWPFQVGEPTSTATFNVISGTSMAAPHLSGIATLLKSLHPEWSTSAIRSAMMTSADMLANDGNPIPDETLNSANFFAIGAGHVNPTKAANPGFVYEIAPGSYIADLCAMGYTDSQATIVAGETVSCLDYLSQYGWELNYPSFMVSLSSTNGYSSVASRNVTNVGSSTSSYAVNVMEPPGVTLTVNPTQLSFTSSNEVLQYTVTFAANNNAQTGFTQGYIQWVSADGSITVGSPIMVQISSI